MDLSQFGLSLDEYARTICARLAPRIGLLPQTICLEVTSPLDPLLLEVVNLSEHQDPRPPRSKSTTSITFLEQMSWTLPQPRVIACSTNSSCLEAQLKPCPRTLKPSLCLDLNHPHELYPSYRLTWARTLTSRHMLKNKRKRRNKWEKAHWVKQ